MEDIYKPDKRAIGKTNEGKTYSGLWVLTDRDKDYSRDRDRTGTGIEPGPGLILNSYVCIYDIIDNTVHVFFIYIF